MKWVDGKVETNLFIGLKVQLEVTENTTVNLSGLDVFLGAYGRMVITETATEEFKVFSWSSTKSVAEVLSQMYATLQSMGYMGTWSEFLWADETPKEAKMSLVRRSSDGPWDEKYHPNEPLWITQLRTLIATQFQLRLDEGTYNPVQSRPVGRQHGVSDAEQRDYPYWEVGVPYVFEQAGLMAQANVFQFIAEHATIESNCEYWSDLDTAGRRRNAAGARFMLWFEVSNG